MSHLCVTFAFPDGLLATAGPSATLGRSNRASVHLGGGGVVARHAQVVARGAGLALEPLDGAIASESGPRRVIPLQEGVVVCLGDNRLTVVRVGDAPEHLVFRAGWGRFSLGVVGDGVQREITGLAGTIGSALLRAGRPLSWEVLAEQLWPDDAAIRRRQADWTEVDEKRFRNRWDQQLATLRAFGGDLRPGGLLRVDGGEVALVLRPGDTLRAT